MTVLGEPVDSPPRHGLVTFPEIRVRRVDVSENILLIEVDFHAGIRLPLAHGLVVHSTFHEPRQWIEPFDTPVLRGCEGVLQHVQKYPQREERIHQVADEYHEDVVESCTVILLFRIDLSPDVPVFPVEVRNQCSWTDQQYNLGAIPKKDKPDSQSEREM